MVCKKCGAQILPEDQFCPECGAKVIRKKRCPECGELYRAGTKFCPSCGAETGEASRPAKKSDSGAAPKKKTGSGEAPRRKADPAPPSKKRTAYRDEPPRRRRDWEDEDWDDDDDEEESVDFLSIMTVAVGCVILVIVAVLGYKLYQQYVPKNYERAAEEQQEEEEQEGEDGQEEENQDGEEGGQTLEEQTQEDDAEVSEGESGGTLVTIADVRIRTSPSTGSDSTVIRTAKTGETFEYIEAVEGGAWYQVVLTGEEYDYGYISADYVETQ